MNDPVPPIWTTTSTESIRTGSWRSALPRHVQAPSPCHLACPVQGDIATWVGLARERDFRGAFDVLARHNPFPAIAGRVCHHPCEPACNRAQHDAPVSICRLERFVGDLAIERGWSFAPPAEARAERIAVVGGGPSGLSAAYHLRRLGYAVTLLEAKDALGGVMRHGIPAYRLPRAVLDAEIARVVALGVDLRLGERPGTPDDWSRLRAEHDAIYVATGAQRPKRLPVLDYARPWVADGEAWLARANAGAAPAMGRRMVVIGGGSAAMDVARSARRAGHDVTVLALEPQDRLPAQREEVDEAREEGVRFVVGAMLERAIEDGGAVRLDCTRVDFEPGARRGEFRATRVAGGEFTLDADAVVTSIGQDPDLDALAGAAGGAGPLVAVDARQATSAERTWAGGDVASLARYVTEAVGQGQRAAIAIDEALRARAGDTGAAPAPRDGPPLALRREAAVPASAIARHHHATTPRATERLLEPGVRLGGVDEVHLPLDVERALGEATRCYSCGTCIACDGCVVVCPDLAVERVDGGYRVLGDYCKGCGLCVRECPTGAMDMVEESR